MSDYTGAISRAANTIKRKGDVCIWRQWQVEGDPQIDWLEEDDAPHTDHTVEMVFLPYDSRTTSNTFQLAEGSDITHIRLYALLRGDVPFTPTFRDLIIRSDGTELKPIGLDQLKPGSQTILWTVGFRGMISALDEIYELTKQSVIAGAVLAGIPANSYVLRFYGRDEVKPPDASKFVIEVSNVISTEQQTSLGTVRTSRADKARLFTSRGTVYARILAPKSGSNNYRRAQMLAEAVRNGYRPAQASAVWYRNARVQELPLEQSSYRFNVMADFSFDERR